MIQNLVQNALDSFAKLLKKYGKINDLLNLYVCLNCHGFNCSIIYIIAVKSMCIEHIYEYCNANSTWPKVLF